MTRTRRDWKQQIVDAGTLVLDGLHADAINAAKSGIAAHKSQREHEVKKSKSSLSAAWDAAMGLDPDKRKQTKRKATKPEVRPHAIDEHLDVAIVRAEDSRVARLKHARADAPVTLADLSRLTQTLPGDGSADRTWEFVAGKLRSLATEIDVNGEEIPF